jgi:hypothetical protein
MIKHFFRWLKWLKNDKPYLSYPGFHCGLCGAWEAEPFKIPEHQSLGKWWDTWGVCKKCIEESEKIERKKMTKEKAVKVNLLSQPKIKCIFLAIVMVFALYGISQAREINLSYGENIHWSESTKNKGLESKMLEIEIKDPWLNWLDIGAVGNVIQSELECGHIIDGDYFSGINTAFIFSGRLTAHKSFLNVMFTELYGGFGLTTQNHYPEFGDSGVIGHFGANIGIKLGDRYIVKYGFSHWSDPLQHHDKGHNFQYISIGMMW